MGEQGRRRIAGRYSCDASLGASAIVARDEQLARDVELRRLSTSRDVAAARRLTEIPPHPNVAVARHDVTDDDGTHYLVVDAAAGRRLRAAMDAGPSVEEVRSWLLELDAGLAYLHGHRVAHGAVSEDHVVVRSDGAAVLTGVRGVGSAWRDRRQLRRLGRRLVACTGATSRERRRLRAQLSGRTPRRLVVVVALAVVATAMFATPAKNAGRELPVSRPAGASPAASLVAAPLAGAGAASDGLSSSVAVAVGAPAATDGVVSVLPSLRRGVGPERVGVYTPSMEYGQFDVFRLDGNAPAFQHRNTYLVMLWSHIATLHDGWLFFYRDADGAQGTAPIEADGTVAYGDDSVAGEPGWTSVTSVGDDVVWMYGADTGHGWAIRYVDGFHVGNVRYDNLVGAGFDRAVGVGRHHVVHYRVGSALGRLVTFDESGRVRSVRDVTLPPGWTAAAGTPSGLLVGVTATGSGSVLSIADGKLRRERSFRIDGVGWNHATALRNGVVFTALSGAARVVQFRGDTIETMRWRVPVGALVVAIR